MIAGRGPGPAPPPGNFRFGDGRGARYPLRTNFLANHVDTAWRPPYILC
jgi:hypothetical protein